MKTSVIIPTLNRKATAQRLLADLAAQTHIPDEIIVLEGGKDVWTLDDLPTSLHKRTRFIPTTNPGTSVTRDMGRQAATGDMLVFFDDDVRLPSPAYIETALNFLDQNPSIMAVGGVYTDSSVTGRKDWSFTIGRLLGIYADGTKNAILPSGWTDYVRGRYADNLSVAEWLFGCNFAVRASTFAHPDVHFETGMKAWSFLDDVFFGAHLEKSYGDCIRVLPQLKVIHAPPSSGGRISPATVRMRILHRYIFWRDHLADGSLGLTCRFWLGMVANLLLMYKQERKAWVVGECLRTHLFNLHHKDMTWETANEFIFSRD